MNTTKDYGDKLFKGTAAHYARFRPVYPSSLLRFLVDRMGLDGTGVMLDLGCGPGLLTLRFADWFERLVGLDPEPEMIAGAERLTRLMRVDNVRWVVGRAEELDSYVAGLGSVRLALIAQAFHWMNRELVLEKLIPLIADGGALALIEHGPPLGQEGGRHGHRDRQAQGYRSRPQEPWRQVVQEVIRRWLGEERRAGRTTYSHPTERHEDVLRRSPFSHVELHELPQEEIRWTIDQIVGFLYSTTYASRRLLGDNADAFEDDLRKSLTGLSATGEFWESSTTTIILALK